MKLNSASSSNLMINKYSTLFSVNVIVPVTLLQITFNYFNIMGKIRPIDLLDNILK